MHAYDIIVVGAGHAGAQAAALLRQRKFDGTIALLSSELLPPYERPPLSKEYMLGTKAFEQTLIRPAHFWDKEGVSLRLGARVTEVCPADRFITLDDGSTLRYGSLIWATGGAPRRLTCPGANLDSVRTIRTRDDVDSILHRLPSVRDVVIVGGGYIGLEAAAALKKLGKRVLVLEALDRVLSRVAGRDISDFFEAKHRHEGVAIRTNVSVTCIEPHGDGAAVLLENGETFGADLVIAGIGIVPATQPLLAAGAAGQNGVDVDEYCRTTLQGVYAVGDCAAHCNIFAGGKRIRLESVQNAHDQAKTAVLHLLGEPQAYAAIPWFWSNQFDVKLQTVGISDGFDSSEVTGDPEANSFSVTYFRQGHAIAVDCVNSPKAFVQGRGRLLAAFAETVEH